MAHPQHLIIIGAMKAGTTSLFHMLEGHPAICGSFIKEPNWFCHPSHRRVRLERHEDLWPDREAAGVRYLMEASAVYTKPPIADPVPEAIAQSGLDPKFIYCVRDPIDRVQSQVNWAVGFSWFDPRAPITGRSYTAASLYHERLRPYLDLFGRDRIHIVDFAELAARPRHVGAQICQFLGLPDHIDYEPASRVRNRTKKETIAERFVLRSPSLNPMFKRLPYRARRLLRSRVLSRFPEAPKIVLDQRSREELRALFRDDTRAFGEAFAFDVAKWGF
jgi:hypothetical protein